MKKLSAVQDNDFSVFFLDESGVLDLELPNGEPLLYEGKQVSVKIYGPATKQFIRATEAQQREATKRVVAAMGKKGGKSEKEDSEADIKFLCAITEEFVNFPYPGGAEGIYSEPRLKYIADQVRAHVGDLGNFFHSGTKN